MAYGFRTSYNFDPVVGWDLYQVTLDKYHVMFHFNNGWGLLNIAHSFSLRSADGAIAYRYEIYGSDKNLNLDPVLRERVVGWRIRNVDDLDLEDEWKSAPEAISALSDVDEDLLTEEDFRARNA